MGRFDYSKVELDSYKNSKIGPFSLFSRLRFESIEGDYPKQELLGIFDIPNFILQEYLRQEENICLQEVM